MVINESLVARTFGSYTLQLFDVSNKDFWIPALGVGLLLLAFLINILGNKVIGKTSQVTSFIKVGGIVIFAVGGLWAADFALDGLIPNNESASEEYTVFGYVGALALSYFSLQGFYNYYQ